MPRVLPAALGAVSTTVLKEAGAYASIDEGGREVTADADRQRAGSRRPGGVAARAVWTATDCADPANPPRITDNRKSWPIRRACSS